MSSSIVLKSAGVRFLMVSPWLLMAASAQPGVTPDANIVASDPGQEDAVLPTLRGKPFLDFFVDSFAPTGRSLGPFAAVPAAGVAVGFRPLKYVQIDALGLNVMFSGLAGDGRQVYVQFSDGPKVARQIYDNSFLLSTGARLALPVWRDRVLLSAGGGWAGLFVNEVLDSNDYGGYSNNEDPLTKCYSCRSRHGWGPTTVAEVMVFPPAARGVGFGFHVRTVQIYSDGISLRKPASPGSNDRFMMMGGTVSLRFGH